MSVSQVAEVPAEPTLSAADAVAAAAAVGDEPDNPAPVVEGGATTSLVWFDADEGLRLGWEVVLGFPDGLLYRVIVDAHDAGVLYRHAITVSVAARANVSLPDPGTPPQMRDIPRPLNDYLGQPWPNESPFPPSDWVSVNSTAGPYVGAHLPGRNPALATLVNGVVTFNPANPADEYARQVTLLYLCSFMHDYLLLLGFEEGNFQAGGTDQPDPVDAIAFPGAVAGTASMVTPPQGSPTLSAGIGANNRHTALDSGVIFHEYTHGLTSRLVGGPENSATLDAVQSGGLGEGWSDYVACTLNNQLVIGAWGDLLWYRHDGWRDGDKTRWTSKRDPVAAEWVFDHVFSGGDGVIYGIKANGDLLWRRHDGWVDGTKRWTNPVDERVGWGWKFKEVFSGGNGVIYAVTEQTQGTNGIEGGQLIWYRHDGWRDGSYRWASKGSKVVHDGWLYPHTFAGKDGVIYAVTSTGELHWFRHDGWHDGSNDWAAASGTQVGHGWSFKNVFCC